MQIAYKVHSATIDDFPMTITIDGNPAEVVAKELTVELVAAEDRNNQTLHFRNPQADVLERFVVGADVTATFE